mgnify:CR=1 FL=1
MKKIILLLVCLILVLPELSTAQNKKNKKKNKKDKTEQVSPQIQNESATEMQAKPIETKPTEKNPSEAKPSEAKPIEIAKPENNVSKPIETEKPQIANQIEAKPINVEQVIAQSKPIIQEKPNGSINWTEQYIEAKGASVIDKERFKNPAQAKLMAKRGAVVDAQRNLLEIIKGVNVTSETTVNDMITTRDYIYTRIDGVIKGAQLIGEPIEKDGTIEVRMRVKLYDQDGIAPAIYSDIPTLKKTTTVSDVVNQVPPEVKDQVLKGLAFNLNGKKFDPSMFPIIVDENNNLVLDMTKLYDPKTGKFPQLLNTTEQLLKDVGFKKGVEVLNVLKAESGKLVIDNKSLKKVNWQKIGQVSGKIGKFLMMLI